MSENALVPSYGERHLMPLSQPAEFSGSISQHHRAFYDDYEIAKQHIHAMVGDLTDFDVFGKYVCVGVFCRPLVTPKGFFLGVKEIKEDWWQHKVVLILKMGPDAFRGKESYLNATFGVGVEPPKVGDWVVANASSGMPISLCGDGHYRPKGKDHAGREVDLFEWDGWPCRIVHDEHFMGRLTKPHTFI